MAILTSGIAAVKSAHWYTRQGEPAHRQPKAKGDGDRNTTITDARKLGLLPSVTTILSILDKPQLTEWKINQALDAANSNPRGPDESVEYWSKRIKDLAFEQVSEAADLGSSIHNALDLAIRGEEWDQNQYAPYVEPVLAWLKDKQLKIVATEQRLVHLDVGFAGTSDVLFTYGKNGIGVLDYKTKKTTPGKALDSYLEHRIQLAAYAAAYFGEDKVADALCANLFISSTEPGRMEVVKVENPLEYWDAFKSLCHVWRVTKGYDPRKVVAHA